VLVAGAVAVAAGAANDPFSKSQGVIDVAVFGDSPYGVDAPFGGPVTDTSQLEATPAFIESINAAGDLAFVLHVGDIHSGKQYCTLVYDQKIYDLWTAFERPLVYTPGDNEWSDCHKKAEGGGAYSGGAIVYDTDSSGNLIDYAGGDPVANLTLVRSIFFADPGRALGGARKLVLSQAQAYDPAHPSDAQYVENVMWEQSKVLFVAIDIPGGSNNDQDIWYGAPSLSAAQIKEIAERTDADIRWLDAAFARAKADGVVGVVIQVQADMWDPEKGPAHQKGFEGVFGFDDSNYGFVKNQYHASRDIVGEIAKQVASFAGAVLLFNGDSHVFRSDNPLEPIQPEAPCVLDPGSGLTAAACPNDDWLQHPNPYAHVANFRRIVVHGSTLPLEWLKLTIDPRAHAAPSAYAIGPFSWQRMTQQ
jgi:hypothetical protein